MPDKDTFDLHEQFAQIYNLREEALKFIAEKNKLSEEATKLKGERRMVFATVEHYGLCLSCLWQEIIWQLEAHLVHMKHEPTDITGAAEGNA
jgi:hypothetical protein